MPTTTVNQDSGCMPPTALNPMLQIAGPEELEFALTEMFRGYLYERVEWDSAPDPTVLGIYFGLMNLIKPDVSPLIEN